MRRSRGRIHRGSRSRSRALPASPSQPRSSTARAAVLARSGSGPADVTAEPRGRCLIEDLRRAPDPVPPASPPSRRGGRGSQKGRRPPVRRAAWSRQYPPRRASRVWMSGRSGSSLRRRSRPLRRSREGRKPRTRREARRRRPSRRSARSSCRLARGLPSRPTPDEGAAHPSRSYSPRRHAPSGATAYVYPPGAPCSPSTPSGIPRPAACQAGRGWAREPPVGCREGSSRSFPGRGR